MGKVVSVLVNEDQEKFLRLFATKQYEGDNLCISRPLYDVLVMMGMKLNDKKDCVVCRFKDYNFANEPCSSCSGKCFWVSDL